MSYTQIFISISIAAVSLPYRKRLWHRPGSIWHIFPQKIFQTKQPYGDKYDYQDAAKIVKKSLACCFTKIKCDKAKYYYPDEIAQEGKRDYGGGKDNLFRKVGLA